ncbi:PREDICTED: failed axon connections-like [Priapulus caudatus]|uniref:Failed axon connections-like n=1 Tax=Priapulus caudatus TaxID=37621 RepID=A0ABM1DPK6_PRICU|nr:PREDICTED: failed axon connections-like [Priapulus caudatus]
MYALIDAAFALPLWVWTLLLVVGYVTYIFAFKNARLVMSNQSRELFTPTWQKDVVYLYGFPRPRVIPDLSPFGLKVETWMRMAGVKYERPEQGINGRPRWSRKGQMPWIELNGEETDDSFFILARLTNHFKDLDTTLSEEEKCVSQAFLQMLEHHTVATYFWYRYVIASDAFWREVRMPFPGYVRWLVQKLTKMGWKKKGHLIGIGRHTTEEQRQLWQADLSSVAGYLGDKTYFMGGPRPTMIDAVLFGHLCQMLYIPIDYPQTAYLRDKCANVVAYVTRLKQEFYSDWDDLLATHAPPSEKYRPTKND